MAPSRSQSPRKNGIRKRVDNQQPRQQEQRLKRQHEETRKKLPVYKFREEICHLITTADVLLVTAETVSEWTIFTLITCRIILLTCVSL